MEVTRSKKQESLKVILEAHDFSYVRFTTIKDILKEKIEERNKIMKPIDQLLNLKYKIIIKELQNNCTHKWEDGSSAIIHLVDDDADGYNSNPTCKEWDLCEICDKVFECE